MKKGSEVSITNECKSKSGSLTLKSEENLSRQKIIPNDSRQKIIPNEPPRQVAEGEGGK